MDDTCGDKARMTVWLAACCAVLMAAAPVMAQIGRFGPPGGRSASASDLVEIRGMSDRPYREAGQPFHLVVVFKIDRGWHMYWKNPGAGATPPAIEVKGPATYEIGEVRWAVPERMPSQVGDMYIYKGEVALFVPVRLKPGVPDSDGLFIVNVDYSVCDDQRCLIGDEMLNIVASTTRTAPLVSDEQRKRERQFLQTHEARLSTLVGAGTDDVSVAMEDEAIVVSGPAPEGLAADAVRFFPDFVAGVTIGAAEVTVAEGRFTLKAPVERKPQNYRRGGPAVRGLVVLGPKADAPSYEFDLPLDG